MGSTEKIEKFYINYKKALYIYAAKILKTSTKDPTVEDMVHTSIYKMIKNYGRYNPNISSLYTWACTIIKNTIFTYVKKRNREVCTDKVYMTEDFKSTYKNTAHLIRGTIDILKIINMDNEPYTVWLLYTLGYNTEDIGDILKLTKRQVGYRLKKFSNIVNSLRFKITE